MSTEVFQSGVVGEQNALGAWIVHYPPIGQIVEGRLSGNSGYNLFRIQNRGDGTYVLSMASTNGQYIEVLGSEVRAYEMGVGPRYWVIDDSILGFHEIPGWDNSIAPIMGTADPENSLYGWWRLHPGMYQGGAPSLWGYPPHTILDASTGQVHNPSEPTSMATPSQPAPAVIAPQIAPTAPVNTQPSSIAPSGSGSANVAPLSQSSTPIGEQAPVWTPQDVGIAMQSNQSASQDAAASSGISSGILLTAGALLLLLFGSDEKRDNRS